MSESHDPIFEAVDARAHGLKVEPWSKSYPLWLVDGEMLTDSDLLALAIRLGLMDSPGGLQ
ncbi:hypothetical protein ABIE45_002752 [Methylobacterium sp. OAE515]|uniref:hypothetical protein n=1 Tax=Methylobacterium sp. OAE515 TaxID=2817895 RepID=UPI00178A54BE